MTDPTPLSRLLRDLGSENWKVASEAQQALVRLGEVALFPVVELLNGDDGVAWRAAWVLGRLKDRRAVPFLSERLLQLRGDAQQGWLHHGERTALLLAEIAEALGALGDPRGTAALCAALWSPHRGVRRHAHTALKRIGRGAVPQLCASLDQIPVDELAAVVALLGQQGDASVIRPLCGLVEHELFDVRLRAVEALGQLAPRYPVLELRRALPLLEQGQRFWSLTSERYRIACQRTLQQIESATGHLRDVPVPSTSSSTAAEVLPLPSAGASEPVPAAPRRRLHWLARLRGWLRGDRG